MHVISMWYYERLHRRIVYSLHHFYLHFKGTQRAQPNNKRGEWEMNRKCSNNASSKNFKVKNSKRKNEFSTRKNQSIKSVQRTVIKYFHSISRKKKRLRMEESPSIEWRVVKTKIISLIVLRLLNVSQIYASGHGYLYLCSTFWMWKSKVIKSFGFYSLWLHKILENIFLNTGTSEHRKTCDGWTDRRMNGRTDG